MAPKNIAGTAMGAWFLSFAMANFTAGIIASMTGGEGGVSLEGAEALAKYTDVFATLAYALLGIGLLIFLLNKPIQRLMHGVD